MMKFARLSEDKKHLVLTDGREIAVGSRLYPLAAQPAIDAFFEAAAVQEDLMCRFIALVDMDDTTVIPESLVCDLADNLDLVVGREMLAQHAINGALGSRVPQVAHFATREIVATDAVSTPEPTLRQLGDNGIIAARFGKEIKALGTCLPMLGTVGHVQILKPVDEASDAWVDRLKVFADRENMIYGIVVVDGRLAFFARPGDPVSRDLIASYTGRSDSHVCVY